MSQTAILKAFLDEMTAFIAENGNIPASWPALNFTPPASGIWLESLSFPNEPEDPFWDNDACTNAQGFFQVAVFYRPGDGQIAPSQMADRIIDYFPKGTSIGGVRVRKKPWQSPSVVVDSSKLFIPVTIPYSGLIK